MSILSLGRSAKSVGATGERWWNWNPARRSVVVPPVATATAATWWSWNPYRRQEAKRIEAEGRREGYAKGAQDENRVMARRARQRRHPIIGFVVLVAAVSGVGFLGLAYEAGSFAGGGAVVDHKIAEWRSEIMGTASRAGAQGGRAVQSVGQTISTRSQQISQNGG